MPRPLPIHDLFSRRSIRRYTDQPVDAGDVDTLLQAAMAAPSAADRKPWHFVVVTDRETLEALSVAHPYAKMLPHAPLCIVPCGVPEQSVPDRVGYTDFWVQDLAAATENMLIAAVGLGLGAVWCGVYPIEERIAAARQILGIPEGAVPFAYVPVGHPAVESPARTQFDSTRVHRGRW